MPTYRVYADTPVFGGIVDDEFRVASVRFFDLVRSGRFILVTSVTVMDEIAPAPAAVRSHFNSVVSFSELVRVTPDVRRLQTAYLAHGATRTTAVLDALHVAIASVARCDMIVSWNFRDIVRFDRIPRYNAVNELLGFPRIAIHSPREVIASDGDQGI